MKIQWIPALILFLQIEGSNLFRAICGPLGPYFIKKDFMKFWLDLGTSFLHPRTKFQVSLSKYSRFLTGFLKQLRTTLLL